MKIIILGPHGQVGGMLCDELQSQKLSYIDEVTTIGRTGADITWSNANLKTLVHHLDSRSPDLIINAIAYTAVDKAESEPELAFLLNSDLPSALADWCAHSGAMLFHYSTDFVFDGMKETAWQEWDETSPLSVYGKSKLAGEKALQMSSGSSFIMRTSWVYGETGNNFMKTMIRLGREREVLGVVADQFGCPTYSRDIAKATLTLVHQYYEDKEAFAGRQHLYHYSGTGRTSWYGFAAAIFDLAQTHETLALKTLNAITTGEYPTPAVRPKNSVLNCEEIHKDFSIKANDWNASLAEVIERYYGSIDS